MRSCESCSQIFANGFGGIEHDVVGQYCDRCLAKYLDKIRSETRIATAQTAKIVEERFKNHQYYWSNDIDLILQLKGVVATLIEIDDILKKKYAYILELKAEDF